MTFVENFPEGFFFIRCKEAPMAMDVHGGGMTNDATIIIWQQKMTDSINQLIICRYPVLDIKGGEMKKDKAIIQYARKAGLATNQRWSYLDGYIFPTAAPHLVLDIRNGDDYKESSHLFLNTKNPNNASQQWVIEPFEDHRSNQDLELLRPPPSKKHFEFPSPEQLCDYYRLIYLEKQKQVTDQALAGAAAFKGLKLLVEEQRKKGEPINSDGARDTLKGIVLQEAKLLISHYRSSAVSQQQLVDIVRGAEQAAASYFSREYEQ
ncbi:hypothetical protein RO3G_16505 [Lichtheimia corymbifera JMRC:FSU:9682]|uniref:Uncharacterized protein n=1 Tax=Lichtheimia corymbifera JMRC:FSU:9682 TaxID=1263082 RepID=A0A068S522_9FUNG|nr:hypothetical protein RO3G_16505 [Lichtheimia corymbifera JMRC:FSU:9682]